MTILVTGATGLIGSALVRSLVQSGVRVLPQVRNREKAERMFGKMDFVVGDVVESITVDEPVDYIIHGASQTSSKAFVDSPVETSLTAIKGTLNLLELARQKNVKGFVYLSSMEVYGSPQTDEKITEEHGTNLDTMQVRSCYPESKRMCENLCRSYAAEYGVPAKIVRLTQTFGPGVDYNDGRVFAEFARCVVEKKDIILHTKGETKRNYLYTDDAVSAILTVLQYGKVGEAYNAANEETYCSIYEMAEMVADGKVNVRCDCDDNEERGYAPVLHMNLDTTKLKALGWEPKVGLKESYEKLIEGWN